MAEPVEPRRPVVRFGGVYRVVRVIGSGGMGAVYECVDERADRRVAVKVLHAELVGDEDANRRFRQEAQAAARVSHPNIVAVLDAGFDRANGVLYIVHEFLEGEDLRTYLGRRRMLPADEALALTVPVMDALAAAHAQGVLHRDVKPENVFLARGADGAMVPKLIDFGIAKLTAQGAAMNVTRMGIALGTPSYMSPEQMRGERALDGRSDGWAIGAVLFELLAGRPPFVARTEGARISALLNEPAPRVEQFAPRTPRALGDLLATALERDRENRFRTLQAMANAARACAASLPDLLLDGPTQLEVVLPDVDRRAQTEVVEVQARALEPLRYEPVSVAPPPIRRGFSGWLLLAGLVAIGLGAGLAYERMGIEHIVRTALHRIAR